MKTRHFALVALLLISPAFTVGCAGARPASATLSERADRIAAKISEAEQLGARECSPRELARAKVALDHAIHEVKELYYPRQWTELEFARAEEIVDDLLDQRRLASASPYRFRCVNRGG